MGYGNKVTLDVYNIGRKIKLCNLYDSDGQQPGAAHGIKRKRELNGWKELTFTLPAYIFGEMNWRTQYMTNEYEVRVIDGDEIDWFRLSEPTDTDDGKKAEIQVTCPHVSVVLKKRNLFLEFTDENGIGTLRQLAERALDGTGWMLGRVDTFYEPDGVTEKVRTYNCSAKTGAYTMIQDLCDKFVAYPIFYGDTMTVDLRARSYHDGMLELRLDKNLAKLSRERDSSDLITRLYVEGEYGDLGYVGIDDIITPEKPKGVNYIMNFDYYKEIGALSPEQEAAIPTYLTTVSTLRQAIMSAGGTTEPEITELQTNWGSQGYVIMTVSNGSFNAPMYGSGATTADAIQTNDRVALVTYNTSTQKYSYAYGAFAESMAQTANAYCVVKFTTPDNKCGGKLAGKEVADEAKSQTIATLMEARSQYTSDQPEYQSLTEQITTTTAELVSIRAEASALMGSCVTLA